MLLVDKRLPQNNKNPKIITFKLRISFLDVLDEKGSDEVVPISSNSKNCQEQYFYFSCDIYIKGNTIGWKAKQGMFFFNV